MFLTDRQGQVGCGSAEARRRCDHSVLSGVQVRHSVRADGIRRRADDHTRRGIGNGDCRVGYRGTHGVSNSAGQRGAGNLRAQWGRNQERNPKNSDEKHQLDRFRIHRSILRFFAQLVFERF